MAIQRRGRLLRPFLACLAITVLGAGPGPELSRFEFAETHMGSQFKIVLYTESAQTASLASRDAFARIAALDDTLSDYQTDSELMRLCGKAGGPPVPVSADLFDVLARSRAMYEKSAGAFDVTVAPIVRLWRRARRERKMPAPDLLARARALVGSDRMILDPEKRTVQLLTPGMKLDVGGIAKGYASDAAIQVLKRHGVTRALVAGDGDIVVSDPPPGRDGWTIGVAPVESSTAPPRRYFSLKNAAVSTSGDAEKFVEIDGKRYSHIVDPKTGLGVIDRASVTVIAPDGGTADSLDTAIYILGPERGLPLVEATPDASALIVRLTPQGEQVYESKNLKTLPPSPPPR